MPPREQTRKQAVKNLSAGKPKVLVSTDACGTVKPLGFSMTGLPFIDGIMGPAGRMVGGVINSLNGIVNVVEEVKAFGARGKGSFQIEGEDDVCGPTKDLPRIKILDQGSKLVATIDSDVGVVIKDQKAWADINSRATMAKCSNSPQQLVESLAAWLKFLNLAQSGKSDMKVGLNKSQPFPQLFIEEGYHPGADWVSLLMKYSAGGQFPCLPSICTSSAKREVTLEEMLKRQNARSSKKVKANKKNAKAQQKSLAEEKKALESALKGADELEKAGMQQEIKEIQAKMNDPALDYLARHGCKMGEDEKWTAVSYKLKKSNMFWKKKDSDLKTEKKALSIMTALQKQRDSTLKVYIDGVYEAIDKVNMILTHLRQTFITCVPYNINLKAVLVEIKYELIEFAKNKGKGVEPVMKFDTDFKLFLDGKSPIKGVAVVDKSGKSIIDAAVGSMGDAMQFVYNLFFNQKHPNNLITIFSTIAASMSSFVKDAITIGRKITNLAEQCVTLAIVPRIQAELAMLVMKPGFKLMDVPKAIVANLKKFTKFPRLAMEVNGTSRKVIGVLGSMMVKDAPCKPMSESGYGQSKVEGMTEAASEAEMGKHFAKASAASKPAALDKIDVSALESSADGADKEDAADVEYEDAALAAEADKELAEDDEQGAPPGAQPQAMDRA